MKEFRCKEQGCNKLLGMIDDEGTLHIDSTRVSFCIEMANGKIICKNKREHIGFKNKIYEFKKIIQNERQPSEAAQTTT